MGHKRGAKAMRSKSQGYKAKKPTEGKLWTERVLKELEVKKENTNDEGVDFNEQR